MLEFFGNIVIVSVLDESNYEYMFLFLEIWAKIYYVLTIEIINIYVVLTRIRSTSTMINRVEEKGSSLYVVANK